MPQTPRHPPIAEAEKDRPDFDAAQSWGLTKRPDPQWVPGSGANDSNWKNHKKIAIDPYSEGRLVIDNYKTLISGIVPRPIGFVSTVDKDGKRNLAPFSFFNVVNPDPPVFTLGFSGPLDKPKDTCRNILETQELTINIISEWFVEAANYCSINSPADVDEWELSGLTPLESDLVRPPHVAESAFSVEAKLLHSHEWKSRADPGKSTGVLCIVEGVRFHVREDVLNEQKNQIDIAKLKPVSRLGGISYGRTTAGYEMPRPQYEAE